MLRTAAAPAGKRSGCCLQRKEEQKKNKKTTQIPQRFDLKKHTGVTTVAATWRLEGDLALLALGVVPDKRVLE